MKPPSLVASEYIPIDLASFQFTEALTAAEQEVLARPLPRMRPVYP